MKHRYRQSRSALHCPCSSSSSPGQFVEYSNQIILACEANVNHSPAPSPINVHLRPQRSRQFLLRVAREDVLRLRTLDWLCGGCRRQHFRLPYVEIAFHDALSELFLPFCRLDRQQRASVAHGVLPGGKQLLHGIREPEQTQEIRDRRSLLADTPGNLFLGQAELVMKLVIGPGFLNRVEILALDILDESDLQRV